MLCYRLTYNIFCMSFLLPRASRLDMIVYSQEVIFRTQLVLMLNELSIVTRLPQKCLSVRLYLYQTFVQNFRVFNNHKFNLLTPNVNYSGRTAPLTSKVTFYILIQQIQVLNILNVVYILRFFLFKMQFVS